MRSSLFRQIVKEYKLSAKLSPVLSLSPDLDDICTRLVDYIGVNFRVREEPLVKEMLADGITAWRAARKHGDPNVAFMMGLFSRAHELYGKRYAAFKGEKYNVWYPFHESIPAFEQRQPEGYVCRVVDEPAPGEITQRCAAFQLAARVLTGYTFTRYFENYDVAGNFSH
ncbi:hypothetical protein [Cupriavidus consociatus]|uniref:hypothetical protein n=1 Tax=Cupriavidus consociatus TaxID=2821357 RepID=UPI001AE1961B|nr:MULTISPECIES: hypothetical protein [unclassified Cupriavidus]MBP0623412.1 hypothetical protein [Cupriavidus sp. LEh25]MDK2660111.1 hypothetical protein [Cupriavidus sp. LEh21]